MPTIKAVLIAPIREAIYNRLSDAADTLVVALSCAEREQSLRARQAFVRLLAVAELLHRIGPTEQESTGALALATIGEATLIVGALHEQPLHEQLVLAGDQTASARLAGEQNALAAPESRTGSVSVALIDGTLNAGMAYTSCHPVCEGRAPLGAAFAFSWAVASTLGSFNDSPAHRHDPLPTLVVPPQRPCLGDHCLGQQGRVPIAVPLGERKGGGTKRRHELPHRVRRVVPHRVRRVSILFLSGITIERIVSARPARAEAAAPHSARL